MKSIEFDQFLYWLNVQIETSLFYFYFYHSRDGKLKIFVSVDIISSLYTIKWLINHIDRTVFFICSKISHRKHQTIVDILSFGIILLRTSSFRLLLYYIISSIIFHLWYYVYSNKTLWLFKWFRKIFVFQEND